MDYRSIEQEMYKVMSAICDSGIPIDFIDKDTNAVVFTMDMDVNRPEAGSRLYEVGRFRFYGVVVEQMLADKISVVSSDKVFRRIKDVIDLYYLSLSSFSYASRTTMC